MKKSLLGFLILVAVGMCAAQSTDKKLSATAEQKTRNKETGPTSIGALKLGMTKEQIESLKPDDETYLTFPMTPCKRASCNAREGFEKFETYLKTPLAEGALETILGFSGDALTSIYIDFKDSDLAYGKAIYQIAKKYGPGIVKNDRREERCLYKNGANFKLDTSETHTRWSTKVSPTHKVETSAFNWTTEICPSNLRYGEVTPVKLLSLTIERREESSTPKDEKNVF